MMLWYYCHLMFHFTIVPYCRPKKPTYNARISGLNNLVQFREGMDELPFERIALQRPYRVYYHASIRRDGKHYCSGALVSVQHVVTAAHCVDNRRRKFKVTVVLGKLNSASQQLYDIERKVLHPEYNSSTRAANIAVVTLREQIDETAEINFIPMANRQKKYTTSHTIRSSGFGRNYAGLIRLHLIDYDHRSCHNKFRCSMSKTFCAKIFDGVKEISEGDPIVIRTDTDLLLVGLFSAFAKVSWEKEEPKQFTYVPAYRTFITDEINKDLSPPAPQA